MPSHSQALLDRLKDEIPHLRRFARSLTHDAERADDLVQDCLQRAIEKLDQFRPGTDLRSWLFTILKNHFIDRQRALSRRGIQVSLEDWSRAAGHRPEQFGKLEFSAVLDAMNALRREERDVLDYVVFEGLRYREVSERLHVAIGTVKSRLARARHSLADLTGHAA